MNHHDRMREARRELLEAWERLVAIAGEEGFPETRSEGCAGWTDADDERFQRACQGDRSSG